MELVQLPAFVEEGGSGPLEVIVSGIIDTQGLGISRTAQVGVIADGTPRAVYRQNAENQRVEMQTSVGPRGVAPNRSTGEIKFIASSGLNDLNDSTLYLEVTAVYRRT